jgi:hypothetical protein
MREKNLNLCAYCDHYPCAHGMVLDIFFKISVMYATNISPSELLPFSLSGDSVKCMFATLHSIKQLFLFRFMVLKIQIYGFFRKCKSN